MRNAIALLAGLTSLYGASACSPPPSAQSAQGSAIVVVRVQASQQPNVADTLRDSKDVLMVLPRTRLEVWRGDAVTTGRLRTLRDDPRVGFVEAMDGNVVAALPIETTEIAGISVEDRDVVKRLTEGAAAGTFRVTAARPVDLTLDLLEAGFAEMVSIPLLGRDVPHFKRTNVTPLGADGFAWSAQVTEGQGDATFVVRSLGVTGNVRYGKDTYAIWPLASGRQLIRRTGAFPPDHPPNKPQD